MPLCVLLRVLKQGRRADVSWAATERSEDELLFTDVNFVDGTTLVIVCDILAIILCRPQIEEPERHPYPLLPLREAFAGVTLKRYKRTLLLRETNMGNTAVRS